MWLGFDWSAVESLLRLAGIASSRALVDDLRAMEGGALAGFNER